MAADMMADYWRTLNASCYTLHQRYVGGNCGRQGGRIGGTGGINDQSTLPAGPHLLSSRSRALGHESIGSSMCCKNV